MSLAKKKEEVIAPLSQTEESNNSLIKKELTATSKIFTDLHNIQLAASYAIGRLADDFDDERRSISPDILFGIRSILEMSAEIAIERAFNTIEFEIEFLSKLNNLQEQTTEISQEDQ